MAPRWLYFLYIDTIQLMHSDKERRTALFWPGTRDVIRWILGTTALCAAFIGLFTWLDRDRVATLPDNRHWEMVIMVVASGCTMMVMMFIVGMQRLEIHGTRIRSANLKTLYRWRTVDAQEVVAMEVDLGGRESMLAVLKLILAPAPHRKWSKIEFFSVYSGLDNDAIDNRFFVPVAEAISASNPAIRIAYLPTSYKGALNHLRATSR